MRVRVERGSMAYSAVTQPRPWPRSQGGTRSSMLAEQMTFVLPISIKAEPSAKDWKPGVMVVGLIWSSFRPSILFKRPPFLF